MVKFQKTDSQLIAKTHISERYWRNSLLIVQEKVSEIHQQSNSRFRDWKGKTIEFLMRGSQG